MIPVAAIASALAKYGPAVYSAFKAFTGGRSHVDYKELENFLNQQHAEGSLSPQDYAAADLTQSRLNESADASGKMLTQDAQTRMRQRGIDSAPAAEATLSRIAQQTARGRQGAGDTAATQLYDTWLGNKQFDQAKKMALIQARLGGAQMDSYAANAERAGNINSLLQYIPSLIPKSGGASTSTFATDLNPDKYGGTGGVPLAPRSVGGAAKRMAASARYRPRYNPATGRMEYASDNAPRYAGSSGAGGSGMAEAVAF